MGFDRRGSAANGGYAISQACLAWEIWNSIDNPAGLWWALFTQCLSVSLKNCGPGKEPPAPQIFKQGQTQRENRRLIFWILRTVPPPKRGCGIPAKMLVTAFAMSSYVLRA